MSSISIDSHAVEAVESFQISHISTDSFTPAAKIGEQLLQDVKAFNSSLKANQSIHKETINQLMQKLQSDLLLNPHTKAVIDRIKQQAPKLEQACRDNPKFDWKASLKNNDGVVKEGLKGPDSWDYQRKVAYEAVCEITASLVDTLDIEAVNIGSQGEASDADITISYKDSSKKTHADQASLGTFSAVAGLVWFSIFGGTSLQQADTEFYPPHTAHYFKGYQGDPPLADQACMSVGVLIHAQKTTNEIDYQKIKNALTPKDNIGAKKALNLIDQHLKTQKEQDLSNRNLLDEYEHLLNNFQTIELSEQMANLAHTIEKDGSDVKTNNEKWAQFNLLAAYRGRFLPESYITRAADVTLMHQQGQLHTMEAGKWNQWFELNQSVFSSLIERFKSNDLAEEASKSFPLSKLHKQLQQVEWNKGSFANHEKYIRLIEQSFNKIATPIHDELQIDQSKLQNLLTDPRAIFDASFKKSAPKDLIASIIENGSFSFHRLDIDKEKDEKERPAIVDSSKYFTRIYQGFINLIQSKLDSNVLPNSHQQKQAEDFLKKCEEKLTHWQTLLSEKRQKVSVEVLNDLTIRAFQKAGLEEHDDQGKIRKYASLFFKRNINFLTKNATSKEATSPMINLMSATMNIKALELGANLKEKFNQALDILKQQIQDQHFLKTNESGRSMLDDHFNMSLSYVGNIEKIKDGYLEDLANLTTLFPDEFSIAPQTVSSILQAS